MRASLFPLLVGTLLAGCAVAPAQLVRIGGQTAEDPQSAATLIAERGNIATAAQIRGADTPPRLVKSVAPTMPREAIYNGIVGAVTADATVDVDGRVSDVRILSSPNEILSTAVVEALRQWMFTPLTINGLPCKFVVRQTYSFNVSR